MKESGAEKKKYELKKKKKKEKKRLEHEAVSLMEMTDRDSCVTQVT
jgi:hypothetical protein